MASGKEVVIRTELRDPVAIGLAKSLFAEAHIPYFTVDETTAAYRDASGFGWWSVLVPQEREDEAREILLNVEATK